MIDDEIYTQRRQQLIDSFEDSILDYLDILKIDFGEIVDLTDWEDNETLADIMGWIDN